MSEAERVVPAVATPLLFTVNFVNVPVLIPLVEVVRPPEPSTVKPPPLVIATAPLADVVAVGRFAETSPVAAVICP